MDCFAIRINWGNINLPKLYFIRRSETCPEIITLVPAKPDVGDMEEIEGGVGTGVLPDKY